jgi:hypothetical protein
MGKRGRAGVASVVPVLAVALVSAGCGSGTLTPRVSGPPGPSGVMAAVAAAEHATSYRFSMSVSVSGFATAMAALGLTGSGAGPDSFSLSGSGAFSASEDAISEQVATSGTGPGNRGADVRLVLFLRPGTAYVDSGGTSARPWVRVSSAALSQLGSSSLTPAQFLQGISSYAASEQALGPATVDGVATTQYSISVRTKQALQKFLGGGSLSGIVNMFSGGNGGFPASVVQAALNGLPPTMQYLVYVDRQGRLRRMVAGIPIGSMMKALFTSLAQSGAVGPSGQAPTQAQLNQVKQAFDGVSETVSMDVWDYGATVHVTAPPADQVRVSGGTGLLGQSGTS